MLHKILVFLIFLSLNSIAFSIEIIPEWRLNDFDYQKWIWLNCQSKDEDICLQACGRTHLCEIREPLCHNCLSTSPKMGHVIRSLGKTINRSAFPAEQEEFLAWLVDKKRFVTLSPLSLYNLVDQFVGDQVFSKFQALCPEAPKSAIIVATLTPHTQELDQVMFLVCNQNLYQLKSLTRLTGP